MLIRSDISAVPLKPLFLGDQYLLEAEISS